MRGRRLLRLVAALAVLLAATWASAGSSSARRGPRERPTPLDTYVEAPDPSYGYREISAFEEAGVEVHVLEMTSQEWRRPDEVDRTVWRHHLVVHVPRTVRGRTALLYIGGGRSTDPPPSKAHPVLARIAAATGSVAVYLHQVPNGPLTFSGDGVPRREDAILAYAWNRFLRTGDATWVPRLPMTKSVVRAMDAVMDFCASPGAGSHPQDGFVVAGSSKRGWTAWTTAAVDSRVVAVVPMVIDLVNVEASFRHHYRSYGMWSSAIQAYLDMDIPRWLGTPEFHALQRVEDPYFYRQRLTLPKLIVNGTGDPFFLPDSSRFYFSDLPGEKHLRYVPNTDHSLNDTDAFDTLLAFHRMILDGAPRPRYSWRFKGGDSIRLRTETAPSEVRLWQASNPEARDFRLSTLGKAWTSSILETRGKGVYVGTVERPDHGWKAFFLEMTYPGAGDVPLKVTTAVRIIPDTLPYSLERAKRGG